MKTFLSILALALLLAVSPARAEEEIEPKAIEQYRADGVTILLPDDLPPFSFINGQGERDGYLPQLWQAWTEEAGIPCRIEYVGEADGLERMENKEADIFGGVYQTGARDKFMDFSGALHSSRSVLAVLENGPVDCSNALYEAPVALVGTAHFQSGFGGKYPSTKTVVLADADLAVDALLSGTAGSAAMEYTPLAEAARKRDAEGRLTICRTVYYDEIYAGVQEGETELLTFVEDTMTAIPADRREAIKARWFVEEEKRPIPWEAATVPAAIVFILIVGAVTVWHRRRR